MNTYLVTAINLSNYAIGESDKVLVMFSKELGLVKAVAKGARSTKAKMAGKSEALCVNKLLINKGKSLDTISQAESIDTYPKLRTDLKRLTTGFYLAELTQAFAEGLEAECQEYFIFLTKALKMLEDKDTDPTLLRLQFEMCLLSMLGLKPELTVCVNCRKLITEYSIEAFLSQLGGVGCKSCMQSAASLPQIREAEGIENIAQMKRVYLSPMVWKTLVMALSQSDTLNLGPDPRMSLSDAQQKALAFACKISKRYLEDRASKTFKTLSLLDSIT
ncbi:MAG: DNA repair protein RecO [Candidatus Melainabacteria bacterium]|nr:DNA repair protein RecO [Candidatus Melainabacteria bacterium]